MPFFAATFGPPFCVSVYLCGSRDLSSRPRSFLDGLFHELANKSTDSQFQFLDRDTWREPWFGHAFLIIFLVAGNSREGDSRQSNSVLHQGPGFFGVGSGLRSSHVRLTCG